MAHARTAVLTAQRLFLGLTLAIGLFALPPSADSYRVLAILPAAFLLAAIALDEVLALLQINWQDKPRQYSLITGGLLASIIIFNILVYYFDFIGGCRYGIDNPQTRFESFVGNYLRTVPPEAEIYYLGDDYYFYGNNLTVDFLSNRRHVNNYADSLDTFTPFPSVVLIATPNRVEELIQWSYRHLQGKLHVEYDCNKQILVTYEIP